MTDFARRMMLEELGREGVASNPDAHPDNRTLYEVYGDEWLDHATRQHGDCIRSGDLLKARRWAHARADTRIRDLEAAYSRTT